MSVIQTPQSQEIKYGVLLVNLGTPENHDTKSVRKFLRAFLMDPRVIDYPRWLWRIILNFAILPLRSPKVAKLYEQIWLPEGSPLRVYTNALAKGVQEHLGEDIAVEVAMTYGSPSTDEAVHKLLARGVNKIVVLPLYPQYSATTTAAAFDALNDVLRKVRNLPEIRFIKHYAHEQDYVALLAQSVRQHRQNSTADTDLLLFSFHGLPKRYVALGDPYQAECEQMAHQVVTLLGLKENQWKVSYQSRVCKEEWVRPYKEEHLQQLAENGYICVSRGEDSEKLFRTLRVFLRPKRVYFLV
ncbi:MAG: ferrochelatase, partial [Psychrosphaera sp.]|nr:ferrochelatase [Psychrosphaera sp.]